MGMCFTTTWCFVYVFSFYYSEGQKTSEVTSIASAERSSLGKYGIGVTLKSCVSGTSHLTLDNLDRVLDMVTEVNYTTETF